MKTFAQHATNERCSKPAGKTYKLPEAPNKEGVFARSLSSYNVIRDKVQDEMQERPGAPAPTPAGKKKKVELGL